MLKRNLLLQVFAGLDDIISANAKAFEGTTIKDQFSTISAKLGELGYDVLLNNKQKAEFVPAGRLDEVVSQRETFKTQVTDLNKQLEAMKAAAKDNPELQQQLQAMQTKNSELLGEIEKTRIDTAIMLAAKDANDPKDVLAFIDRSKIKANAKGEITGIDEEITRLKTEKAYLFGGKKKAGIDNGGGSDDIVKGGMNAAIRRMAGRI